MPCRVAVIGGAGHLNYITEGLAECDELTLCAVAPGSAEEDADVIRKRLRADDDVEIYDDYHDLLDRECPDIVCVSPLFFLHDRVTCAALQAGCAVYSEKPLAITMDGLRNIREAQRESGRPVGIMLDFRYRPAFRKAKELVAAGVVGTPTVAYGQKSYKRGNRPDLYKYRSSFGGITPWVGIHAIDWVRWISGCEYRSVFSRHVKLHRPDYPEMEDAATCLYELSNGASAVLSFDFLRPPGAPSHGDDRLRLMGERAALEIRTGGTLELIDEEGVRQIPCERPTPGAFADFARSVLDNTHSCAIGTEEAIRVTEIALKTRESADRELRIPL